MITLSDRKKVKDSESSALHPRSLKPLKRGSAIAYSVYASAVSASHRLQLVSSQKVYGLRPRQAPEAFDPKRAKHGKHTRSHMPILVLPGDSLQVHHPVSRRPQQPRVVWGWMRTVAILLRVWGLLCSIFGSGFIGTVPHSHPKKKPRLAPTWPQRKPWAPRTKPIKPLLKFLFTSPSIATTNDHKIRIEPRSFSYPINLPRSGSTRWAQAVWGDAWSWHCRALGCRACIPDYAVLLGKDFCAVSFWCCAEAAICLQHRNLTARPGHNLPLWKRVSSSATSVNLSELTTQNNCRPSSPATSNPGQNRNPSKPETPHGFGQGRTTGPLILEAGALPEDVWRARGALRQIGCSCSRCGFRAESPEP